MKKEKPILIVLLFVITALLSTNIFLLINTRLKPDTEVDKYDFGANKLEHEVGQVNLPVDDFDYVDYVKSSETYLASPITINVRSIFQKETEYNLMIGPELQPKNCDNSEYCFPEYEYVNNNTKPISLPLAADVQIFMIDCSSGGCKSDRRITVEEFTAIFSNIEGGLYYGLNSELIRTWPFKFEISDGIITKITQLYLS